MNEKSRIFYVSSAGSDENSGLSANEPLRTLKAVVGRLEAGDTVLLKCGDTFAGDVEISARGTADRPIRISSYGEGDKPLIGYFEKIGMLFTGDHITVENLAFSSPRGDAGLRFLASESGAYCGYKVLNCYFHHINTIAETGTHLRHSGGVAFLANSPTEPAWFDGILVEGCEFDTLGRGAIFAVTDWCARVTNQEWGRKNLDFADRIDKKEYPILGFVARNNKVNRCSGDAMHIIGSKGALFEYNTVANSELLYNNQNYLAYATIWCHSSDDCVIQHNEVYGNRGTHRAGDLQAFDFDHACHNCIVQYNYSHDNAGGFMLFCGNDGAYNGQTTGSIVRFNLSVNDGGELGAYGNELQAMDVTGTVRDSQIYNNTIYCGKKTRVVNFSNYGNFLESTSNTVFTNNIFCASEDADISWGYQPGANPPPEILAMGNAFFKSNAFCNIESPEKTGKYTADMVAAEESIMADPQFANPGAEEKGLMNGKNYVPSNPAVYAGGVEIEDNGGMDYFGNPVPAGLIGAIAPKKD